MALTRDVVNCPRIGILAMFTRLNFGNTIFVSNQLISMFQYDMLRYEN